MNDRPPHNWRPLTIAITATLIQFAVVYRFLPFDLKANFVPWPFAAWAIYAGARLGIVTSLATTLAVFGLTDLYMYKVSQYPPNAPFYICLIVYVLLGRVLLARSTSPWRVGLGTVAGYAAFFLITNFAAWLEPARPYYKPYSITSLLQAYGEGLEFIRMQPAQIIGAMGLPFVVFGVHATLARLSFPAERVEAVR
jgi:hypothetical protein